jgi:hypothetical protein
MRRPVTCVLGALAAFLPQVAGAQPYQPSAGYGYEAPPPSGSYGQPGYYPPSGFYRPDYRQPPTYTPPRGDYPRQTYPQGSYYPPGGYNPPGGYYPPGGAYPPRGNYPPGGYYPPGGNYPPGGSYPPGGNYPPGGSYPPNSEYGRACREDRAAFAIGRRYSQGLAEQARRAAGARIVRLVRPGMVYTQEFRQDRLNLQLDRRGQVESVRCG